MISAPEVVPTVVVSPGAVPLGVGAADVDGTPVVAYATSTANIGYDGISFPQHILFKLIKQTNSIRMESIVMLCNSL